ncbi:MAG: bifunctional sulfate adenylyltransferase/adenylylsulfate kinase [Chlamydiales bacterium]|nr:bifunctional sulfate adenylyltransferase/adenylylsulfate kinase [Chlamydiales bacterium]
MKAWLLMIVSMCSICFASDWMSESKNYPQVAVERELLCDVELLLNGGFAPLEGFLNEKDYHSVLDNMRLENGSIWPIPIVFPMEKSKAEKMFAGGHITLLDDQSYPIAIFDIEEMYTPDVEKECMAIYGCIDDNHPMIKNVLKRTNSCYLGGKLRKISLPHHFDFSSIRFTPQECKDYFKEHGWKKIVGFQTRNPLHRSHVELTHHCMNLAGEDAKLLLHPVVGTTQPDDVSYWTRVKCYQKLLKYYPEDSVFLSLLPLSMRMAGPREALWHALIRKNYGCTHFIIGRDHAGPSVKKKNGETFFGPYDAHRLLEKYKEEIGVEIIPSVEIVYDKVKETYVPITEITNKEDIGQISGTEFRRKLTVGEPIPTWFSYPDVLDVLQKEFRNRKGTCIYFVGLSGSGKSTLAQALKEYLKSTQDAPVVMLDGDVIRKYLASELGFSKKDRSINVRRIGFIASLIAEAGGVCLCANIAPYEEDRMANRELISSVGKYVEVYVKTPLEVCESRDVKGLYKAAREGKIPQFTGISDPFEEPIHADVAVDSSDNIEDTMEQLVDALKQKVPYLFQ